MTHEEFFKATDIDLDDESYEFIEELYLSNALLADDFCEVMSKVHLIPGLMTVLLSAGEHIQTVERRLDRARKDLDVEREMGDEALKAAIANETAYITELCRVGASAKARAICGDNERVLRIKVAQKLALDEVDFELLEELIAPEL